MKIFTLVLLCLLGVGGYLLSMSLVLAANTQDSKRIALVIGNSHYQQLGSLSNTMNDAKSINKALIEIGYKTRLVSDANEATLRKEIKTFSSESENASIALVFYAGHGAQVNGENFLLPVDMDIPKNDSDVQFSSIKVDDVINSIKSKVKVVFLDACRDNPVLIKSLAKGRGSYRGGLAPASAASIADTGGGIFIAYATDTGNVALDGDGQNNSPFTHALLKHIKTPISIDDMFSMVTKDVREATKNTQRPYKYASLDGVFCLTERCGLSQSEQGENLGSKGVNISVSDMAAISNDATENWILYMSSIEKGHEKLFFIDSSSIEKVDGKTHFKIKYENHEKDKSIKDINANHSYDVGYSVMDCASSEWADYKMISYDATGKKMKDLQFGLPGMIPLINKANLDKNKIAYSTYTLACNPEKLMPIVSPEVINSDEWDRLWTINPDKGVDLYYLKSSVKKIKDYVDVIVKVHYSEPTSVSHLVGNFPFASNIFFTNEIVLDRFSCAEKRLAVISDSYFDVNGRLIELQNFVDEPVNRVLTDPSLIQFSNKLCGN